MNEEQRRIAVLCSPDGEILEYVVLNQKNSVVDRYAANDFSSVRKMKIKDDVDFVIIKFSVSELMKIIRTDYKIIFRRYCL